MKKLFFIAALIFVSIAADAQCIKFKISGCNLGGSLPAISPDGKKLTFNYSVTIYVEKIGACEFEKVDNATFSIPINDFDPLTVTEVMNDSALIYVEKNYPNIK